MCSVCSNADFMNISPKSQPIALWRGQHHCARDASAISLAAALSEHHFRCISDLSDLPYNVYYPSIVTKGGDDLWLLCYRTFESSGPRGDRCHIQYFLDR